MKQIPPRVSAPQPLTLLTLMIGLAAAALVASIRPDVGQALTAIGRAPAQAVKDPVRMNVMHVPCWNRPAGTDHRVAARWVRLTGAACAKQPIGVDRVVIRNLSNGFVATVFSTGKNLTTDYIPLNDGVNEVVIALATDAGPPVETRLRLTR